ncbi:MAG: alternative ribosome rescue aminoacyl-tRNA hydrolase ArfB [Thermoanaerobaculia bacterium]|nr:alternative ribosome rescue aminoacyl-tRNA hydrolase ArfB [Thermoanaerobaculia bacterium]
MIEIRPGLAIDETELEFVTSRSSGPGGQNVNKVESRVTLHFDVAASAALSEAQKERLRARLATRINRAGVLRVVSQKHRTQRANRDEAVRRFAELVGRALERRPPRRRTRVPEAAKRRRLEQKRRRGRRKSERRAPGLDE